MTDTPDVDAAGGLINAAAVGVDYQEPDDAPAPEAEDAGAGTAAAYDPGLYTVDQVNAYIADHPDERDAVLAAEAAGRNRAGIVGP